MKNKNLRIFNNKVTRKEAIENVVNILINYKDNEIDPIYYYEEDVIKELLNPSLYSKAELKKIGLAVSKNKITPKTKEEIENEEKFNKQEAIINGLTRQKNKSELELRNKNSELNDIESSWLFKDKEKISDLKNDIKQLEERLKTFNSALESEKKKQQEITKPKLKSFKPYSSIEEDDLRKLVNNFGKAIYKSNLSKEALNELEKIEKWQPDNLTLPKVNLRGAEDMWAYDKAMKNNLLKSEFLYNYDYTDKDITSVNKARNARDEISYIENSQILIKNGELLKDNAGNIIVEMPAVSAQDSSFELFLDSTLNNLIEVESSLNAKAYPAKIIFPYHNENHWSFGEIIISKNSDKISIVSNVFDSLGNGELEESTKNTIKKVFESKFSNFSCEFDLDRISATPRIQNDSHLCGTYSAILMHNAKTKDITKEIDNNQLINLLKREKDSDAKSIEILRIEDYELLKNYDLQHLEEIHGNIIKDQIRQITEGRKNQEERYKRTEEMKNGFEFIPQKSLSLRGAATLALISGLDYLRSNGANLLESQNNQNDDHRKLQGIIRRPTRSPSQAPSTISPTTTSPSQKPSTKPSDVPSLTPSFQPTIQPSSVSPTSGPSQTPSLNPSQNPSLNPSQTLSTNSPTTTSPSQTPSLNPSQNPSLNPSQTLSTNSPTTTSPSQTPSLNPSQNPSLNPSQTLSTNSPTTTSPSQKPSTISPTTTSPSQKPSTISPTTTSPSQKPSTISPTTTSPSQKPSTISPTTASPSQKPSTISPTTTSPSQKPTRQPSIQPSSAPSSIPTGQPSTTPSVQPTVQPSGQPSTQPSSAPSSTPSAQPSIQPTGQPSSTPSAQPTIQPTGQPTIQPTGQPSVQPSGQPSVQPSGQPSVQPSGQPSVQPSGQPSIQPSSAPSSIPTGQPSIQPSSTPSSIPTGQPSATPSVQPSIQPSSTPSSIPTGQPSATPSVQPTVQPSGQPTIQPSSAPSSTPTGQPTIQPSSAPSSTPTGQPTSTPSDQPSSIPTGQPTSDPSSFPTSINPNNTTENASTQDLSSAKYTESALITGSLAASTPIASVVTGEYLTGIGVINGLASISGDLLGPLLAAYGIGLGGLYLGDQIQNSYFQTNSNSNSESTNFNQTNQTNIINDLSIFLKSDNNYFQEHLNAISEIEKLGNKNFVTGLALIIEKTKDDKKSLTEILESNNPKYLQLKPALKSLAELDEAGDVNKGLEKIQQSALMTLESEQENANNKNKPKKEAPQFTELGIALAIFLSTAAFNILSHPIRKKHRQTPEGVAQLLDALMSEEMGGIIKALNKNNNTGERSEIINSNNDNNIVEVSEINTNSDNDNNREETDKSKERKKSIFTTELTPQEYFYNLGQGFVNLTSNFTGIGGEKPTDVNFASNLKEVAGQKITCVELLYRVFLNLNWQILAHDIEKAFGNDEEKLNLFADHIRTLANEKVRQKKEKPSTETRKSNIEKLATTIQNQGQQAV